MADRGHPDADQILGRQPRQQLRVDIILAESQLVLLEPEPPQPLCNIHRRHARLDMGDGSFLRFREDGYKR
jgi:hypothetical protein